MRLTTPEGREIGYDLTEGEGPGIVFLGGFRSDRQGTKAVWLQDWAEARGRAFLRFDYSGHGDSSGRFEDGTIGQWAEDAVAALDALTEGPQVLVGSSMGGWIALLLALRRPGRVAGIVGIAAAPDFTEDGFRAGLSDAERAAMERDGRIERPSDYSDTPEIITRALLDDGARHLVLRDPLVLPAPAHFLQGSADADVPVDWALRLLSHAQGPDVRLTIVKGADHRFSTPDCLRLIAATIEAVARPPHADA